MSNLKIDPTKSALQNLLDLVDAVNTGGPSDPAEVTTGNLQAVTPNGAINTEVTLTGTGSGPTHFTGEVTIQYGRLTVAAEAAVPAGPVIVKSTATDAEVLTGIAGYFGFVPGEIALSASPTRPGSFPGTGTAEIAASGSLLYEDGNATVNLNWLDKQTALLMHFDGASPSEIATDAVGHTFTVHGDAGTHNTDTAIFGSSAYWGATAGSFIDTPDADDLHFSGDFTFEFFGYVAGYNGTLLSKGTAKVWIDPTGLLQVIGDSGSVILSAPIAVPNAWDYYLIQKKGSAWILHFNQQQQTTATSSDTWGVNSTGLTLGNDPAGDSPIVAYLDEMRLSQVARYGDEPIANPSAPFTVD